MTAQSLCEYIRVAYDPKAASLIDSAHAEGQVPEMSWLDVGPSAAGAQWGTYSGLSVTWSMTGAPRGNVQSTVLARLLAPHRNIARKRVTLLYRPVPAARAAGMVEADLSAAQFRPSASRKTKARDSLAVRAAAATASEEASGAGLVNFGMLVTATVTDTDMMLDAAAACSSRSLSSTVSTCVTRRRDASRARVRCGRRTGGNTMHRHTYRRAVAGVAVSASRLRLPAGPRAVTPP